MFESWVITFGLLAMAALASISGILLIAGFQRKSGHSRWAFLEPGDRAEFLFDDDNLLDATPVALDFLRGATGRATGAARAQLMAYLERHFPGVEENLQNLSTDGSLTMTGDGPLMMRAEWHGGMTRIALIDGDRTDTSNERTTNRARQEELEDLRRVIARIPTPIWRENPSGDVVWANTRYIDLASDTLDEEEDLAWPLPRLFPQQDDRTGDTPQRQALLPLRPEGPRWFDVNATPHRQDRLFFATPADATVQAENSLRDFMQTLTKTFAQLPTGLAIFDHGRKLTIFNPALLYLTTLPPDFLSARPTLISFFDAMRERSMIPEPRDYKSWRDQITDLEQAAIDGLYCETWSLPNGQTFRVTGRPHPNGAMALLFEDISTEISQTRRYRADLELGQAVVDAMDDAIAVFSASGMLVMSNTAYSELWGHDPAGNLDTEGNATAICDHWRSCSAPSGIWDRAEDFIAAIQPEKPWADETRLADGRRLQCRFTPLAGGTTLATFIAGTETPAVSGTDQRTPRRRSA
ncbi:MAG: PAS-domain containing protein [Pseudorhodobacter sp.]